MIRRRQNARYRTKTKTPVRLLWTSEDIQNITRGQLKDISMRGAMAMTNSAPPVGTPVAIKLEGDECLGAIEATVSGVSEVVGVSLERWRSYMVRLAFRELCPQVVLEAAADNFPALLA